MSRQRTLRSCMGGAELMKVDTYKFFQDCVTKNNVTATLKEAFDYCQATFDLPPLGGQVPDRDVRVVKDKCKHSKVR